MARRVSPTEFERSCADGEVIVREGESGREMFVIQSGAVEIFKQCGGEEVPLARLSKGDFFGEMSLLEDQPRDASARAAGPTRLLVIQAGGLLLRIRRDPTFAYEMLYRMSGRIRDLNAWLTRALEEGDRLSPEAARTQPLMILRTNLGLDGWGEEP